MFGFDADQTLEALYETRRPQPPVPVRTGPSPLLALVVGILIGRKSK